jgi:hypothetical protein
LVGERIEDTPWLDCELSNHADVAHDRNRARRRLNVSVPALGRS